MKSLVREIHRRSLWQVLGIYLAGSWVALQVMEQLTEAAGLPEWVRPFSLGLLVLGFPIVMATAFVQEGLGTQQVEGRPLDPSPDAGEVDSADTRHEKGLATHHKLFTWRNAILGGVGAFALLGFLTVGYLFLRTAGIGPAGTLVAQGVIEEGAKVVLAEFESPDPDLADVVGGALRIDLLQSPTIQIVESGELADALRRMQRDVSEKVTADVAREVAIREGYAAVIEGEVLSAGSGYVLTANIRAGTDWASVAAFRRTARGEDDLIDAIEGLSRDIRDKSGESLRALRNAPPLEQVSTSSLEALRTYTRAQSLEVRGDRSGAVELYERALEIDPDFAMAHRKLGVTLGNMNVRPSDAAAAFRRAYELRERLPESERYLAEADYHYGVTGDRDAEIRAYETLLDLDPDNHAALNNLGLAYESLARWDEAEALYMRAIDAMPSLVFFTNLARTRVGVGAVDEGLQALSEGAERLPGAEYILEDTRVRYLWATGRYARADSVAAAYAERFGRPEEVARAARQRFISAATRGQLRAAEPEVEAFELAESGQAHPIAIAASRAALYLIRGDSSGSRDIVLEAYDDLGGSVLPADRRYDLLLDALLAAGADEPARRLYREWVDEIPEEELGTDGRRDRRRIEAALAYHSGNLDEAVRRWETYERTCPGWCARAASLGLALVHDRRGDLRNAIAELERYLSRPALAGLQGAIDRAPVLERLGQLYDLEGDARNAAKHYATFVELWAEADDELQPRVRAAQARLEEILGEIG